MKEYALEDLLHIKNGRDHKHLHDGNIPVYGSGGIMRYGNQAIYDDESILLPRKGTLSNIQFVNKPFWTVDTIYYTIINKEKADPLYLYYYLKQLDLSYLNSGTGVPSMTFGAYYQVKVNLPSLDIQHKIAKVISDYDIKIELNNRINSELEAMAKMLYDYWFVQFDFPYVTSSGVEKPYKSSGGKMVWNEALKREIPEGWEVATLGKILHTVNHSVEPDEFPNLKYLPIDKLPSKQLYYEEYSEREHANSSLIKFLEDDILLGAMRVYFHRVCNAIEDGISRSTIMVLRPFESVYKNFGLFTLSMNETIDFANKNSTGTSIPYAKWEKGLSNYKIICPNKIILEKFNIQVKSILNQFKVLSKENQELASLRDWLLPMLMNGQVRVGEVEEKLGMVAEPNVRYNK